MLKISKCLLITIAGTGLSSCYPMNQIQNPTLRDKVYACGVIWGDNINSDLSAKADQHLQVHGTIQAGFKDDVRTIFDKLPPKDAEEAYKNYISCIENLNIPPAPAPGKQLG